MADSAPGALSATTTAVLDRSTTLARSSTRKKKTYDITHQGIRELYPQKKSNVSPDLDVVFVPGLGAHPEESWKSGKTGFNWTTNPDGLQRDFPRARLLLYMYDSAWAGPLKVKQFMSNISMGLLVSLRSVRENCPRRPIVFIGHSMGGLVIAKAVVLADSRRELFPIMFDAITACIFFGTPFGGAPIAAAASMYARLAEKVDAAAHSKLLDLMKPGDEELRQLKNDFLRLSGKSSQKIELFCFWETHPTDFSAIAGLPGLFGLTKMAIPKKYADFVNRDSATLPGIEELGLGCNHRDLVKFDGPKDDRWLQMVRDPIKKIIHGAHSAVKNRFHSVRDIDQALIRSINDALEGTNIAKKKRSLAQTFAPSSWIPTDPQYVQWLDSSRNASSDEVVEPVVDLLYIRGREGRGKTSAIMAALDGVEELIRMNDECNTGQDPILLAYFFCDGTADCATAEDLLKSLIKQLINQQETLAPYAKVFTKKKGKDDSKSQSQQQASMTVENLWQSLQDMLADEFIGSRVYLILNNLHVLPPESHSTLKLMEFISAEIQNVNSGGGDNSAKRVLTRWFITSREAHTVDELLKTDGVRVIDLEDAKYENQVQLELRRHAKKMISALGVEKKYNKALTYFASSLVGKRAQNTQWIDITCVQLAELAETESHLKVRGVLETMPQDLKDLLNHSWTQIFRSNDRDVEKIKEMLRALVLTYEDPTETELGVLAGLASNEAEKSELRRLIEQCKPLLSLKRTSKSDSEVFFTNVVTKNHLRENAHSLLGLSKEETKWQHGILALRCFSHLKDSFDFPALEMSADGKNAADKSISVSIRNDDGEEDEGDNGDNEDSNNDDKDDQNDSDEEEEYTDYSDSEDEYNEDDEREAVKDPEADILKDKAAAYAVKHWLHHASNATLEIAEDLSLERDFWKANSIIRHRWLVEYARLTPTFQDFDYTSLTGLHVAAAIGFRHLVAALIRNGHESEIQQRDSLFNSPLHFAAYLGRPNIVEELLNRGAVIDDAAEIQEQTPLHMAAFGGHVNVMKKLLLRQADANAIANDIGPVINAAISSGNRAAVELLVEHNVSFSLAPGADEDILSPLAMAAELADYSMFEYLIERYADRIPTDDYSEALVCAAIAGRLEVFQRLLSYNHPPEAFQSALNNAVEEWNWDVVKLVLENRQGLDCNAVFLEAAIGSEPQDKMVELAWQYAQQNGTSITRQTLNDALFHATDREKLSTVKLLLQAFGANPNATGDEFGTALTAAAFDGNLEMVDLLLGAGAEADDGNGWAVQTAAAEGHFEIVRRLVEHGADVNACTFNENFRQGTALQGACEFGKSDIVSLLLEHNANPNLGAGPDAPPIVAAAMRGEEDIVSKLVAAKADLDVFGGADLSTPLINSAAYLPTASIKLILDAGADINLPNHDGESALIVAARRGEMDAVSFLIDNGADLMHSSKHGMNALQSAFNSQQYECLGVLVSRVSVLLTTIKKAVDSGNYVVAKVVRTAEVSKQTLAYDDEMPNIRFQHKASGTRDQNSHHDYYEDHEDHTNGHDDKSSQPAEPENNAETGDVALPSVQNEPHILSHNPELFSNDLPVVHHDHSEVQRKAECPSFMPPEYVYPNQVPGRPLIQRLPSWQSHQQEELHYGVSPYAQTPPVEPPIQRVESPASPAIKRKPTPQAGGSTSAVWAPQCSQGSSSPSLVHQATGSFSSIQSGSTEASSWTAGTVTPQYQAYQPALRANQNVNSPPQPQNTTERFVPYTNWQQQQQAPSQNFVSSPPLPYDRPSYDAGKQKGGGQGERGVRHKSSLFGMKNLLDRRW